MFPKFVQILNPLGSPLVNHITQQAQNYESVPSSYCYP